MSEGEEKFKQLMLQRAVQTYAPVIYSNGAVRLQELEEMLGRETGRAWRLLFARGSRAPMRS